MHYLFKITFNEFSGFCKFLGKTKLTTLFVYSTGISLLASLLEIVFARMIAVLFEFLQTQMTGTISLGVFGISFKSLTWILIAMVLVIVFRGSSQFYTLYLQELFREKIEWKARNAFIRLSLLGEVHQFEQSELTNILADVIPKYSLWLAAYVRVISLVISTAVFCSYSLVSNSFMFVVVAVMAVFTVLISKGLSKRSTSYGQQRFEFSERFNHGVGRAKRNHKYLKILGAEESEVQAALTVSKSYFEVSKLGVYYYSLANVLPNVMGLFIFVAVVGIAAGRVDVVKLIPLFYILLRIVQSVSTISANFNVLKLNEPQYRKVIEAFNREILPKRKRGDVARRFGLLQESLAIQIDDLSVSHPNSDRVLLSGMSLSIRSGELTFLYGRSGCGKSTFINSLLGVGKVLDGKIYINGHEVSDLSVILDKIGYVGADPYLIRGTVRQNLLFGYQGAVPSDDEILAVCNLSGLDDLILDKQNLDTLEISENGEGLSAGQKQRVSIARAMIRNPRLLILDEGTANLDVKTEARVLTGILGGENPPAVLVVSHRRSIADFSHSSVNVEIASVC